MTAACHRRGYDKTTEPVGIAFDIPFALPPFVTTLPPDIDTYPNMFEPQTIACSQVARLAEGLRTNVDPEAFDCDIDANEERHAAGGRRAPARARA